MKQPRPLAALIATAFSATLLVGCASTKPPEGSAQVREKLTQLQSDSRLATLAPVAIKEAESAVRLAEEPREDKGLGEHFVYLADRKVDTARALAEARYAEDQRKTLGQKATQAQLDARTKEAEALRRQLAEMNAKQTERGIIVTLGDVLFETAKADLKANAHVELTKLVAFLQQESERAVVVEGHTDNVGTEAYNQDLSQRRADSVKAFLLGQGIQSNRVTAVGKGESTPVASNDSSSGRQLNRRVEIVIAN